jgi:glycosyltransferase involved in cell wall biosynthesis
MSVRTLYHDAKDPAKGSRKNRVNPANKGLDETIYSNKRAKNITPRLSIASPYFRDDPTQWVTALAMDPRACDVEVVLVDDGTGDDALDESVRAAIDAWPGPATLVRFHANKGRPQARNRAIEAARGDFILFMDADMLPGDGDFLTRYFEVIDKRASAIVFGGFKSGRENVNHDTLLNYSLALKNDCKPASARMLRGALAVASNNILVRRDVFTHIPFDNSFKGWGWEDTEWAMRAVFAGYGLTHIDNPAIHQGLDSTQSMLRKYKEAGANLRRLLDSHPEAAALAGAKVAKILRFVPIQAALRPVWAWMARDPSRIVPLRVRELALKLWRASHAAEALVS